MKKSNAYPTKKTLNLMIREKGNSDLRILIPAVIVACVFLVLFCKFAVIDRLAEANRAEQAAEAAEAQLAAVVRELEDYDAVEAEYTRYFSDALRAADMPQECMDVLGVMERSVMRWAEVESFAFSGNTLLLELNVSRLGITSQILNTLYQVPMVEYVSISTATDTSWLHTITPQIEDEDEGTISTVILTITLREVAE